MRRLFRLLRCAGVALLFVVAAIGLLVAIVELGCRGAPSAASAATRSAFVIDAPGYKRDQASTYFTFPEWYIVYAAEDLGNFVATQNESGFPYLTAIQGFWESFCTLKRNANASPSLDVAVMIYTIGISFTAEYAIKGIYENTIGRVTEWLRGGERIAEDRFAQRVAADYAKFLYAVPWYKYPFATRLKEFWQETPAIGAAPVRKWERRAAVSLEYAVKAGYGWLIQKTMDVSDGEDARDIMFAVRDLTVEDLAAEPRMKVVKALDGDATLVTSPRYQVFTDIAIGLSRKGRVIAEIAGNHDILLTAILPGSAPPPAPGLTPVIAMPLSARPGMQRAGFVVKVDRLVEVVREFDRGKITIEHLFDY